MKPLVISLLWRNALVAILFMVLVAGFQYALLLDQTMCIALTGFFVWGLAWSNRILYKQRKRILAICLIILLVPILGFPAMSGGDLLCSELVQLKYRRDAMQFRQGCNGGAASLADDQVRILKERLEYFQNDSGSNSTELAELQKVYAIAQDKARILSADCGWRGHRDTIPWKTNWAAVGKYLSSTPDPRLK